MLYAELLEEVNGFGNEVGVKFVQVVVEQRCEVLWQVVRLLQAGAQAVSQSCDVRYVCVVLDLRLFFDSPCKVCVVDVEQPSKNSLLNLLVILFFKEIIL